MTPLDLLKGRKVKVMTDAKVEVELQIKEVKETSHSEDLTPATRENDWYPDQRTWLTFDVTFTNGLRKQYNSINEIILVP